MSTLKFKSLCLALAIMSATTSMAQTPSLLSSSEILQGMKKLNVLGSVLYIAAHPDDENTRMLAWLSKEKLYRTAYLSLTRGDGGQNLIGDEQGDALGVIRTRELMAARKIDGAEQFFSSACDFGYSKNPEETFQKWEKEKLLFEMVWIIRSYKPDVIICRFPTTGEGGHGQHTASAILASEAFDAAADSSRFPEQLQSGLSVWKAKRLLWNTFNFGGQSTQKEDQFKINVGGYDPMSGKSFGEIASLSRSQHKSQGFGVPAQRGDNWEYLATIKGDTPKISLLDGVNTTWERTGLMLNHQPTTASSIAARIDSMIVKFDVSHPERSLPALLNLYDLVSQSTDSYWKIQKQKEIKALIESAAGIYMEAVAPVEIKTQGDSLDLMINFISQLGVSTKITGVQSDVFGTNYSLASKGKDSAIVRCVIPKNADITQPYWLRKQRTIPGMFSIDDNNLIGMPEKNNVINIKVNILGHDFNFEKPILFKMNDPVNGETYHPLVIAPKFVLEPQQSLVNMSGQNHLKAIVYLRKINADGNGKTKKQKISFDLKKGMNQLSWSNDTTTFTKECKKISYNHIPDIFLFPDAQIRVIDVEKARHKKVGYIDGAGDHVEEALRLLGYEVVMLNQKDINHRMLEKLDAVVTGVRCYNVNEWMDEVYDTLMEYVKSGGKLIVQYNTSNNIGPLKSRIGPYPFKLSRNRITDEHAEVHFLHPNANLMKHPNLLSASDFEGWVQERSIYHVVDADTRYEKIFSMHDPGVKEDDGALITTHYGKGTFIYTGLSLFRQLPAGVTGAYHLLQNLLWK